LRPPIAALKILPSHSRTGLYRSRHRQNFRLALGVLTTAKKYFSLGRISGFGLVTNFGLLRVAIAPKSALHSRRSRRPKTSETYQRSNQGIAIIFSMTRVHS